MERFWRIIDRAAYWLITVALIYFGAHIIIAIMK